MALKSLWLVDHAPIMGGAEMVALRLARHAREARGLAVRMVCPQESLLTQRCAELDIPTIHAAFPGFEPWRAPAQLLAVRNFRGLLRGIDEDTAVVTLSARAQAYTIAAALTLARRPPVVHLVLEQDTAHRLSAQLALPRHGRVLALGANTAETYRRALRGAPVGQLNNFLTADEMAQLRAANQPRQDSGTLGVLARMIPAKGILELIRELADHTSAWQELLVAGPPESSDYEQAVRAQVRERGLGDRVQLLGQLAESRSLLQRVGVLIVPSTGFEGQPTVIIEALAAGLPVVVRRPVHSQDYAGLPVFPYSGTADLASALEQARQADLPSIERLLERFGPDQALDAIAQAAGA